MEPWFAEAKSIPSLQAEIGFLLQDDFYFGPDSYPELIKRKEAVPLQSPAIPRILPGGVRTSEAIGHERELAEYYQAVLRIAQAHGKNFNEIRQYFWLQLELWNPEERVYISFPWYDTYSEIAQFLTRVSSDSTGQVFSDLDQGWELEVHAADGEFFIRLGDPENDETHTVVRLPRQALLAGIQSLRTRTESIIQSLSSTIGRDLWTRYVEWPEFCPQAKPEPKRETPAWWQFWKSGLASRIFR